MLLPKSVLALPASMRFLGRSIIPLQPVRVVLQHNGLEQCVLLCVSYLRENS